jgi:hypothetical protein
MKEIQHRTAVIGAFRCGSAATLCRATTVESVYLQFRKILELIAFGSLIANKSEVSKVHRKFSKYWLARCLLRDIERLNPDFYPRPFHEVPSKRPAVKMTLQYKKDGFLTKKEFLDLYGKCGAIMHASNPYGSRIDYGSYERSIPEWLGKIIGLLHSHTIRLVNSPKIYVVDMQEQRDGKVRYYELTPLARAVGWKPAV